MKSLLLSGYKIHLGVDDGKLIIKDGVDQDKEPSEWTYRPRNIDLDQIVLYGHTGDLSISAIKWLMKQKVPIQVLDYNGTLLTCMNPPQSKNPFPKINQYKTFMGDRIPLAKKFIEAKLIRSEMLLGWVLERYPKVQYDYDLCKFDSALKDLKHAERIREIMGIEGIVARHYWDALVKIIPEKFEFEQRGYANSPRPMNAVDPVNALFNYGYSYLEGLCRRAVNSTNLDPNIGFLHEVKLVKEPLVYDMQEPFRWLVDMTIIKALERKIFHKNDFLRTDDYVIRIRPKGVNLLVEELDRQFSQVTKYGNRNEQWSSIIDIKANELSNFLVGKKKSLDFSSPSIDLERIDNKDLRDKIINMSYYQWHKMGYSKGTLYYMKKNAKENKPFTLYPSVRKKLEII